MAERPDTDPLALAHWLRSLADESRYRGVTIYEESSDDLCAAADGLRRLAAITTAIGDPEELNRLAKIMRGIGATLWADHIGLIAAAASLTPTPTPTRCPTCGSDDPAKKLAACIALALTYASSHPWHNGGDQ